MSILIIIIIIDFQNKYIIIKSKKKKFLAKFVLVSIFLCLLSIIHYYINDVHKFCELSILNKTNQRKYKIIAITYANNLYQKQIKLNRKSALEIGNVDEHLAYGPSDIDELFKKKNKNILSRPRGNGYWLWKPYIINKTIVEKLNDGDYLIYTDAAMIFMDSSHKLIDFLREKNASMWMNKLRHKERLFSKRDAFILIGVDSQFYRDTNCFMAGIQIYKKSNYTVRFIQEWLFYCQDQRIITDDNNKLGFPNYEGFIENRHDQTALSLLIKKYGEANAGSPERSKSNYTNIKPIIMPNIICIYRRIYFKDYEDLKKKCAKLIEIQSQQFS